MTLLDLLSQRLAEAGLTSAHLLARERDRPQLEKECGRQPVHYHLHGDGSLAALAQLFTGNVLVIRTLALTNFNYRSLLARHQAARASLTCVLDSKGGDSWWLLDQARQ